MLGATVLASLSRAVIGRLVRVPHPTV
jgi:hypothetical protein